MEEILDQFRAYGDSARITAGFCWPWSDPLEDGSLVKDVAIDDWSRPWTSKNDRSQAGVPPGTLWATDPGGFGQVGTVYTTQGFEYDWAGVIFGPDVVVREGRLTTVPEANLDPALRNRGAAGHDDLRDTMIRNVYRVLLTRGLKGTILFAVDPATQQFLTRLIEPDPVDHDSSRSTDSLPDATEP